MVDCNGDAVEVDYPTADALKGPELRAFDAEIAVPDAAPGRVKDGWVLVDYAFPLDLRSTRVNARNDSVAPPFLRDVFARLEPFEVATLEKIAGVKLVQLFEFRVCVKPLRSRRDVAFDYGGGLDLRMSLEFKIFQCLRSKYTTIRGGEGDICAESSPPFWILLLRH